MYAAGVKPHVDMISIEPFGFGYSAEDPAQRPTVLNFQRVALVRRTMLAAGDGTTPLLAARFGWNQRTASPWRTVDPVEQQAFLDDGLAIAWRLWPWLAGLGWAIDQPAAPFDDPIWGFELNEPLIETIGVGTDSAAAFTNWLCHRNALESDIRWRSTGDSALAHGCCAATAAISAMADSIPARPTGCQGVVLADSGCALFLCNVAAAHPVSDDSGVNSDRHAARRRAVAGSCAIALSLSAQRDPSRRPYATSPTAAGSRTCIGSGYRGSASATIYVSIALSILLRNFSRWTGSASAGSGSVC